MAWSSKVIYSEVGIQPTGKSIFCLYNKKEVVDMYRLRRTQLVLDIEGWICKGVWESMLLQYSSQGLGVTNMQLDLGHRYFCGDCKCLVNGGENR